MSLSYQTPEQIAINSLRNRDKLPIFEIGAKGVECTEEMDLIRLVTDIVDGMLEGERRDLKQLQGALDHIIRNTPHSCQTEEHCCALHAAHKAAAEKTAEHVQWMIDKIGKGEK